MARSHEQNKRQLQQKGVMRTQVPGENAPNKIHLRLGGVVETYPEWEKSIPIPLNIILKGTAHSF